MRFWDIVMAASTQGGGSSGGATELWPQPNFAASTGLTFTAFDGDPPSVSGGQLNFGDGSQDGMVESGAVITETGTYRISSTSANAAGPYEVVVGKGGGGSGDTGIFDGDTTTAETHDVVISALADGKIRIANNYTGQSLSHFSVTKIA